MSKNSSSRYYQKKTTNNRFLQCPVKDIKILLKKKKTENENIIVNEIKISQKMRKKG